MLPLNSLVRPQFGIESAYGTPGAVTRILTSVENNGFNVSPVQDKEAMTTNGFAFATSEETIKESSKGTVKAVLDYRDFGYFLASQYGLPSVETALSSSAGVTATLHRFEDKPFDPIAPQSYNFEYAKESTGVAYSVTGLVFLGTKIDTARDKNTTLSVNVLAKVIASAITPSAGVNDVQTVTLTGATGGVWGLLLANASPLLNLAYNITPANLQTAIRALGGDWSGATVTGSAGVSYVITNVLGKFVPTLVPVYTDLITGAATLTGTTPTATVVHTTPGGLAIHAFKRVLAGQIGVSFATNLSDLVNAPTILSDEFETGIDIADRFSEVWRQNTTDVGHGAIVQRPPSELKDVISLTMAYNAAVAPWIDASKNDTRLYVRVKWVGGNIGLTGQKYTITYDATGFATWSDIKDSQGNIQSVMFSFNIMHDVANGFRSRWEMINDIANYTS